MKNTLIIGETQIKSEDLTSENFSVVENNKISFFLVDRDHEPVLTLSINNTVNLKLFIDACNEKTLLEEFTNKLKESLRNKTNDYEKFIKAYNLVLYAQNKIKNI